MRKDELQIPRPPCRRGGKMVVTGGFGPASSLIEGTAMRGTLGLVAAVIFLGAASLNAQAGRPMARPAMPVQAVRMVPAPVRPVGFVRPAPPTVRVGEAPVRVVTIAPGNPGTNTTATATSTVSTLPLSTPVVTSLGGTPIPLGQLLNPAPGLGFDFTHLAAINSDLAVRAIIDPLTQQELALTQQLPQEAPAAFFPDYGYGTPPVVVGAPAQPQIIVLQQPAAQPAVSPQQQAAPAPAPQAATPPPPPLPPLGNLFLVERDGKVIQATAFTEQGKQVVYITPEGRRKTIAISQLDLKATEDRNAERGTFLHLTD